MDPILQHHYMNLAKGKAVEGTEFDSEGRVNPVLYTVHTMQVDIEGVPTLIPSVWDGQLLGEQDAIDRAIGSGIPWPQASDHSALRLHDIELHKQISPLSPKEAAKILEMGRVEMPKDYRAGGRVRLI
jgi:hypothetical protein